jgi:hypothetical protein
VRLYSQATIPLASGRIPFWAQFHIAHLPWLWRYALNAVSYAYPVATKLVASTTQPTPVCTDDDDRIMVRHAEHDELHTETIHQHAHDHSHDGAHDRAHDSHDDECHE